MSGRQRLVSSACARLAVALLGVVASSAPAPPARAQAPGSLEITESIDDPKLERRLGTRIELVASGLPPSEVPAAGAASPAWGGGAGVVTPLPVADAVAVPAAAAAPVAPRVPRLKVAYRWLTLAQLAAGGLPGRGADETFHVVSLDFYPISSVVRFGLSTQYGWENGTFRANGDAFLAESLTLGFQAPGQVFTPFVETQAGAGLMQRMHIPELVSNATAYLQFGVDVGTEIFLARHAHLSLALGWVRGVNYYAGRDPMTPKALALTNLAMDTFSIKVGFGI
jgi:hypothetical protein